MVGADFECSEVPDWANLRISVENLDVDNSCAPPSLSPFPPPPSSATPTSPPVRQYRSGAFIRTPYRADI